MSEPSGPSPSFPIPRTDEEVFNLLAPFPIVLTEAIAATVLLDDTISVSEYQALAKVAANLDELSPIPGLMVTLILRGVLEGPAYSTAMRRLKAIAKDRPENERLATFQATTPLIQAQPEGRADIATEWAEALNLDRRLTAEGSPSTSDASVIDRFLKKITSFRSANLTRENPFERARRFARSFDDDRLATVVSELESSPGPLAQSRLTEELNAAVERAFRHASAVLKTQDVLDQQLDVAGRFLRTAEALREQIQLRLRSVKERLDLQSGMFHEDLDDFVRTALDSVEISMRDLMEGRRNWADKTIWEQFKTRGALSAIVENFQPLKHRYQRVFDQWQRELELFAQEVSMLRVGVLKNIDPQAFANLLPTDHSAVTVKNAIDRAADTTLGVAILGTLGAAGAVAMGVVQAGVLIALVSNPVGATVATAAGLAAAWKVFSNPEARKRKLTQTKRRVLETKLREALQTETFNHDEIVQGLMNKFLEAAYQQYTPLIIEARMIALRAKLEAQMVRRVLSDTRKVLMAGSRHVDDVD